MLPTRDVRTQLGELLAADTTTLAPAAANKIALISAPFSPNEDLEFADLTLATFTGSTPKAGAAGTQQVGIDPATGEQVITNLAPAGGWRWECTAAPTPPQSIYGFALVDNAVAVLLATEALATPVTITNVGDFIDLGAVKLTILASPIR